MIRLSSLVQQKRELVIDYSLMSVVESVMARFAASANVISCRVHFSEFKFKDFPMKIVYMFIKHMYYVCTYI